MVCKMAVELFSKQSPETKPTQIYKVSLFILKPHLLYFYIPSDGCVISKNSAFVPLHMCLSHRDISCSHV